MAAEKEELQTKLGGWVWVGRWHTRQALSAAVSYLRPRRFLTF